MSRWMEALRLTGVGFFIGACVVFGVFSGIWVDMKLGTEPVFILVGLFTGVAGAFYGVYLMILPLIRRKSVKENK